MTAPDPLDGVQHVLDREGQHIARDVDGLWRVHHPTSGGSLGMDFDALLLLYGPITPLVPGEPIHPEAEQVQHG